MHEFFYFRNLIVKNEYHWVIKKLLKGKLLLIFKSVFDTFPKSSLLFEFRRRVSEILQMLTRGLSSKRSTMGTWLSTCIELMLKLAFLIIIIKNILFIISIPLKLFLT